MKASRERQLAFNASVSGLDKVRTNKGAFILTKCSTFADFPLIWVFRLLHNRFIENALDFRPDPDLENIRFQDFLGLQRQQRENTEADEPYSSPYSLDPDEEQWEPDGASYYNGELIRQPSRQRTREEQLWLLDNHPLFTSVCPQCKYQFPQANFHIVHYDCPNCGWVDDSV